MPKINLQGTEFEFSILPFRLLADRYWVRAKISIKNEYVNYVMESEEITRYEMEKWLFSAFRLLAGAYEKPRSVAFEKSKTFIDLIPFCQEGVELTRQTLRENDCLMAIRLVMTSSDKTGTLGGVYSLLMHRKEIEVFANGLKEEFDKVVKKYIQGKGKYSFIGVSPFGFNGCNYWYLDETGTVKEGDYVWAKMGRRKIEQILYVDSVRKSNADDAPYPLASVKKIIRKATEKEVQDFKNNL